MNPFRRRLSLLLSFATQLVLAASAIAQPFPETLFSEMRWRMIGPFRAGRTVAASGIPGNTNVFYAAANNGGVWKTTDAGRVWTPIFDDQPTGSIGALAVAPSRPDTLYVGSGEGLQRPDLSVGDGIYKSTDAGKTWAHLGLRDGQQIAALAVHPRDPDRVYAAVLGHPYGPNDERGVFRSTDGGVTWTKVLYKDENTGASAVTLDPSNPDVVYAVLWAARQGPWENGEWQGPESGLFKSLDGGTTWKKLTKGLPTFKEGLGRIGICVSPADPRRLYATVDASPEKAGIYVSDDAGESFTRVNGEERVWGRGSDFAEVRAHPKNRDEVWAANISTYRSTDGGRTFTPVKGAPGGDDYHTIFIHPENPDVVLLASDQGATISVNAGATWSSWYNQPTAQLYHVSTDSSFPYRVCGGQQESGSACVQSRGDDGQITFREWHPVAVEEYGYVAPDPLDPDVVYDGKVSRYDRRTGQARNVSPHPLRGPGYRVVRTQPVLFSPFDPKVLYFA
ncbi:MAG TPA: glycoside hydrolase, partial [Thermoanaerobaculia bacterium]|nr:glycoside hydrolase [Thermoanaerobaculia bacterium]